MENKEYIFTDDMAEISGFGGGYEAKCRAMVVAGLKWFDENPKANPRFRGNSAIYGHISEDNEDAKTLSKVMVDAAENDCTGAMHQATVGHVMAIVSRTSWDWYVEDSKRRFKEDQAKEGK